MAMCKSAEAAAAATSTDLSMHSAFRPTTEPLPRQAALKPLLERQERRHSCHSAAWRRVPLRPAAAAVGSSAGSGSGSGRILEFATDPGAGRSGRAASHIASTGKQTMQQRLQSLGLAGVVAYGLLNTLYYTVAFFVIWRYVARVPRGLGLAGSAAKFTEVAGLTWAGSQVTKIGRAAGAVVLAPAVDALLETLQRRLRLRSKQAAFGLVLTACLATAAAFYGSMILAWA